jgi:hypothetical protein
MDYVSSVNPLDEVVEQDGARVMIAPMAQMFLIGTEIDYETGCWKAVQVPQPQRGRGLRLRRIDQVPRRARRLTGACGDGLFPICRLSLCPNTLGVSARRKGIADEETRRRQLEDERHRGLAGRGAALLAAHPAPACEMLLCPPATLIAQMAGAAKGSALRVGGQDCHAKAAGAHTGDISARCWPMPAPAMSSLAIPNAAPTMANRCAGARQGRGRPGRGPDRHRLHRRDRGRARRGQDAGGDRQPACRVGARWARPPRTWSSPMNPSGPSAPAARPRWPRSPRSTAFLRAGCAADRAEAEGVRCSMVGRSSRRTRPRSLPCRMSTARWSAGPA